MLGQTYYDDIILIPYNIIIISMLGARKFSFPMSLWTPQREFVEYKEASPEPQPKAYEDDPVMQDKQQIIEDRETLKEKTIKQKERAIPGAKLLKLSKYELDQNAALLVGE